MKLEKKKTSTIYTPLMIFAYTILASEKSVVLTFRIFSYLTVIDKLLWVPFRGGKKRILNLG